MYTQNISSYKISGNEKEEEEKKKKKEEEEMQRI